MIILLGLVSLLLPQAVLSQEGCCSTIRRNRRCIRSCEQLEIANGLQEQVHALVPITENCPMTLTRLWGCINNTYPILNQMDIWPGRVCCDLSSSRACRAACKRASSENDLLSRCPQSDENFFYDCIERQTKSEGCCGNTNNFQCRSACRAIFASDIQPTPEQKQDVEDMCGVVSPSVVGCVSNYTQPPPASNPAESLPCCDKATDVTCRDACREVLVSQKSEQEIVELLTQKCSEVDPLDGGMWQCFFLTSDTDDSGSDVGPVHTIDTIGIDSARLQCCVHAATRECHELCTRMHSSDWANTWSEFNEQCQKSGTQTKMLECIAQVDEPCQMGCNRLSYCTNFNHRPSELFRSCNANADTAARAMQWESGVISSLEASVSDVKECDPEFWKTIACSVSIKPCNRKSLTSHICRSDCIRILTKCVDPANVPSGYSIDTLCDQLAPSSDENTCISLTPYLEESPHKSHDSEVTHPCSPNPCNASQICMVNRRQCRHKHKCKPYVCKKGCRMGDASTTFVPHSTYVQIPNPGSDNSQLHCHKTCHCGHRGVLGDCVETDCVRSDSCLVGGQIFAHEKFTVRGTCQQCLCYSKEMICTERNCLSEDASAEEISQHTGLPCNCQDLYDPVCGVNGRTYGNLCLARCAGLDDDQYGVGACHSRDPCQDNPCGPGRKCIPRRQVCLSLGGSECRQHECVSQDMQCNKRHHDPVCDTKGDEHVNVCFLISANRKFAHGGHCLSGCKKSGVVCGHNGETYSNECAAWAERISMDYPGPCQQVGKLSNDSQNSECDTVHCSPLMPKDCRGVTPPGACCPVCAAEIRVMFSRKQVEQVSLGINRGPLTVQNVTEKLRQHISVKECDIFGYLSMETDIVLLVRTVTSNPTHLQVDACNAEAYRLSALIRTRHPTLMSDLILSPLILSPEDAPGARKTPSLRTSHIVEEVVQSQSEHLVPVTRTLFLIVIMSLLFV